MANTKDEVRVSRNFVNLIQKNEGLLYKTVNRLFNIESFSDLKKITSKDIKLEEPFEGFGRMDILIDNQDYFLIIETKVHNPTEPQETQTSSYFNLMKKMEKEHKKTFLCYLINNGHPESEFNNAVKKHNNSKIEHWNDLIEYLYKNADSSEKTDIEYFINYSENEIDNFSVELEGTGNIFGSDVELIANPFLLSTIDRFFYDSEIDNWILNSFVVPALKKIDGISKIDIEKDTYDYVIFNYKDSKFYLNLTQFYNPRFDKWSFKNSFTFYRPWIVGCHEATSENQIIEYTKKAIVQWLNDNHAQTTIISEDEVVAEKSPTNPFGDDVEIFSNPWLLANTGRFYTNKKPEKKNLCEDWIYQEIVIPSMKLTKQFSGIQQEAEGRRIWLKANYKGVKLWFDLSSYYDSKTNEMHDYNTFTFYRPWIIGCRYSTSVEEMRDYTTKAILLWLRDVDEQLEI